MAKTKPKFPVSYQVLVRGTADAADPDAIRAAFKGFVRKLRDAGVTVGGALTGNAAATRDEAGELTEGTVLHDDAADVEDAKDD